VSPLVGATDARKGARSRWKARGASKRVRFPSPPISRERATNAGSSGLVTGHPPPPRSSNNVILLISLGYFQAFPPTRRHEDDEAVSDPLKSLMSAEPHQSIDVTTCRAHVDTSDLLARRKALTLGVIAPVASPRARDSLSKRPLRKTTLRSLWRDHLLALSLFFSFFLLDKRYRQGRGEGEA